MIIKALIKFMKNLMTIHLILIKKNKMKLKLFEKNMKFKILQKIYNIRIIFNQIMKN